MAWPARGSRPNYSPFFCRPDEGKISLADVVEDRSPFYRRSPGGVLKMRRKATSLGFNPQRR